MCSSSLPTAKKNFFHPQIDESCFIFHFCGHQGLAKEKWGPDLSSLTLPVTTVQLVRWQLSSHLSRNIPVWGRFSAPWVVPLGTVPCTTCFRHSCVDQPSSFVLSRNIWETNVPKYWEEKTKQNKFMCFLQSVASTANVWCGSTMKDIGWLSSDCFPLDFSEEFKNLLEQNLVQHYPWRMQNCLVSSLQMDIL